MMKKHTKKLIIWISAVAVLIAIMAVLSIAYINDYYPADLDGIEAFSAEYSCMEGEVRGGLLTFGPEDSEIGFIFYPGGKVEYRAYIPLMKVLASKGIFCLLVEMPANLAILDVDAAEGLDTLYPDVVRWYIGGHSLGGSMAATYLSENEDWIEGIVLLASYSTADLSEGDCEALSVYGSEDGVLNKTSYEKYRQNLPEDFEESIIDGGCHAYFGMYGLQEGDGIPTVSNAEQIEQTAALIEAFMLTQNN